MWDHCCFFPFCLVEVTVLAAYYNLASISLDVLLRDDTSLRFADGITQE